MGKVVSWEGTYAENYQELQVEERPNEAVFSFLAAPSRGPRNAGSDADLLASGLQAAGLGPQLPQREKAGCASSPSGFTDHPPRARL